MAIKTTPYISASQIKKFGYCPILYKHDYVDGGERMPPNIYMLYGTAIHKALEYNFKQKIKSRKDLPHQEVYAKFEEVFDEETDKHNIYRDATYSMMIFQAQGTIEQYITEVAPDLQPLYVEYEFELKLKNFPITIKGYIDLITEDGRIIDYKTSGKSWKSQYRQTSVDKDIQLTLYSAAYRKAFGKVETGAEFHILPRGENQCYIRGTTNSEAEVIHILQQATIIEKIVELGVFMPNLSSCSTCALKDSCPKIPWVESEGGYIYLPS